MLVICVSVRSIVSRIWAVCCPVSLASRPTSSATTPNPRPCSPARAASIAAFSASSFVCRATPSIIAENVPMSESSLLTSPSSRPATRVVCSRISSIASITLPTSARPRSASDASSDATVADSREDPEACSEEVRSESTRRTTSSSSPCRRSTSVAITPTDTELRAAPIENSVVVSVSSSRARANAPAASPVSPGREAKCIQVPDACLVARRRRFDRVVGGLDCRRVFGNRRGFGPVGRVRPMTVALRSRSEGVKNRHCCAFPGDRTFARPSLLPRRAVRAIEKPRRSGASR